MNVVRFATCPECRTVNLVAVEGTGGVTYTCLECLKPVHADADDLQTLDQIAEERAGEADAEPPAAGPPDAARRPDARR